MHLFDAASAFKILRMLLIGNRKTHPVHTLLFYFNWILPSGLLFALVQPIKYFLYHVNMGKIFSHAYQWDKFSGTKKHVYTTSTDFKKVFICQLCQDFLTEWLRPHVSPSRYISTWTAENRLLSSEELLESKCQFLPGEINFSAILSPESLEDFFFWPQKFHGENGWPVSFSCKEILDKVELE